MNVIDLVLGETEVRLVGDPHQGRAYRAGVPLHRRGEREEMSREAFQQALDPWAVSEMLVIVGDIFDKFIVDPATVLFVYTTILQFSRSNPHVTVVIIRGNHDASRDSELRSSFDLLVELLKGRHNVHFAYEEPLVIETEKGDRFAFLPWHPFVNASEMVDGLTDGDRFTAVMGHWDIDTFGGEHPNLIPTEKLAAFTDLAITGHVHQRQEFERDGVKVIVTGSLLPQAHGEDLTGELFVTLTLDQLEPESVKDKCVRLRLRPGEEAPADLDCLQLVLQRVNEREEEVQLDEVEMVGFDLKGLWETAAAESSVSLPLTARLWSSLANQMEAQE